MEQPMVELQSRPNYLPSILCAVCLLLALGVALFAWRRDIRREEANRTYIQTVLQDHINAADSLRAHQAELDTVYAKEYAQFEESLASLERLTAQAQERTDAVYALPTDSLGAHIRRLLARARNAGIIPARQRTVQ